jgi:hypothetical protein
VAGEEGEEHAERLVEVWPLAPEWKAAHAQQQRARARDAQIGPA